MGVIIVGPVGPTRVLRCLLGYAALFLSFLGLAIHSMPLAVPVVHVEDGADGVGWAGSSRAMEFFAESQLSNRYVKQFERDEVFLGLAHRGADIKFAGHEQGWCGHIAHVHDRRLFEPACRVIPEGFLEKALGEEWNIGGAEHAYPVADRAAHGRGGKAVGVSDHPA